MKTLSIIGFGDFARLMVKELSPYFEVMVSTRKQPESSDLNCKFVDTKTALGQEIIIPSMPSQFLEEFFLNNLEYLNPKSLVIDVCSVKVKPVEILTRILPKSCMILATHPMFGPFSAAKGLDGLQIMTYPVRITGDYYSEIKNFLSSKLKLNIVECSPEEHDKELAYVLGLTQLIGRASQNLKIPETILRTRAYDDLLDMKNVQGNDSWELFESIVRDNPYCKQVIDDFAESLNTIKNKVY